MVLSLAQQKQINALKQELKVSEAMLPTFVEWLLMENPKDEDAIYEKYREFVDYLGEKSGLAGRTLPVIPLRKDPNVSGECNMHRYQFNSMEEADAALCRAREIGDQELEQKAFEYPFKLIPLEMIPEFIDKMVKYSDCDALVSIWGMADKFSWKSADSPQLRAFESLIRDVLFVRTPPELEKKLREGFEKQVTESEKAFPEDHPQEWR